eukprot:403356337
MNKQISTQSSSSQHILNTHQSRDNTIKLSNKQLSQYLQQEQHQQQDPNRIQVFKKLINREKLEKQLIKAKQQFQHSKDLPKLVSNQQSRKSAKIEEDESYQEIRHDNFDEIKIVQRRKSAATGASIEKASSKYGEHKEFQTFLNKTMNPRQFKENQKPLINPQSMRFVNQDFGEHYNKNTTTRISSNNIIQAPLLISSEDFKIRKLNPNKLYKALQSYYQQVAVQDHNYQENKKQGFLYNKKDLIVLMKSKNGDRIQQLLQKRNVGYQEKFQKWQDFKTKLNKSTNDLKQDQTILNNNFEYSQDMQILEDQKSSRLDYQLEQFQKFINDDLNLTQKDLSMVEQNNRGLIDRQQISQSFFVNHNDSLLTEEKSQSLVLQDEGIQCTNSSPDGSKSNKYRSKSKQYQQIKANHQNYNRGIHEILHEQMLRTNSGENTSRYFQGFNQVPQNLEINGFNVKKHQMENKMGQSGKYLDRSQNQINIQTGIGFSDVKQTGFNKSQSALGNMKVASTFEHSKSQERSNLTSLPSLQNQNSDLTYLYRKDSSTLQPQILDNCNNLSMTLDHSKLGGILQSKRLNLNSDILLSDRNFLNQKLTSHPGALSFGQLMSQRNLKSNQLLRRDAILISDEELGIQSATRKRFNKSMQQSRSQINSKQQQLLPQATALIINKTLKKDIHDPIVMRRDFNNIELISDSKTQQQSLAGRHANRKTPGFIYPLVGNY